MRAGLVLCLAWGCAEDMANDGATFVDDAPPPVVVEESFVSERVPADVLLMIDNSSSMADEQAALAADLEAFAEVIAELGAGAHVGMITADCQFIRCGRMREVQGSRWITGRESDLEGWLAEAMQPGITGPPTEQGLYATAMAIGGPAGRRDNAGFYRVNADLHVVTVTDERDYSPDRPYADGLAGLKVDGFQSFYHLYAGRAYGNCMGVSRADGYVEVWQRVGGVVRDVCDLNAGFLTAVARELVIRSSGRVFELAAPATNLSVSVDEGAGPVLLAPDAFTYEEATRLVFLRDPVVDGATVSVTYTR
jgi:hypothetical protein